jgi:hypothetical protein
VVAEIARIGALGKAERSDVRPKAGSS